jgi:hypothetical protein
MPLQEWGCIGEETGSSNMPTQKHHSARVFTSYNIAAVDEYFRHMLVNESTTAGPGLIPTLSNELEMGITHLDSRVERHKEVAEGDGKLAVLHGNKHSVKAVGRLAHALCTRKTTGEDLEAHAKLKCGKSLSYLPRQWYRSRTHITHRSPGNAVVHVRPNKCCKCDERCTHLLGLRLNRRTLSVNDLAC